MGSIEQSYKTIQIGGRHLYMLKLASGIMFECMSFYLFVALYLQTMKLEKSVLLELLKVFNLIAIE